MKQQSGKYHRKRFIAGICAITILVGGFAGVYAFNADAYGKSDKKDSSSEQESRADKKTDDGIISAGGTITSSQLSDELGLKNTSARLTVEKVLVESGDSVTSGTKLYQISSDSLAKAKKTLDTELKSAKNALIEQKTEYQSDKIKAYSLYQSQLLTGKNAQQEYNTSLSSLESSLSSAYDSYKEALDTISNTPAQITSKKKELSQKEEAVKSLEQNTAEAQKQSETAEKTYLSAAENYNSLVTSYNSAASVVRYLGSALGKDVSGIELAQSVSAASSQGSRSSGESSRPSQVSEQDIKSFDVDMQIQTFGSSEFDAGEKPSQSTQKPQQSQSSQQSQQSQPAQQSNPSQSSRQSQPEQQSQRSQSSASTQSADLNTLYENAYKDYTAQKEKLNKADTEFKAAQKQYKELSESLAKMNSELKEAQSSVSSLNKEISSLESSLSKAKSNLTKLRSQYESLKASYETDKLDAKNKLDTDTAASENAEYNYKITLNTIESELEEKQSAYDTAAENVSIFEKTLAQGYICAKQEGIVSTLNYKEGRNADVSSPFVYYVDTSDFKTTVELDQYDVTQINIGDTVMIYSSETGVVNAKITGIAAGESTSLANVKFNVTVTADKNSNLYSGQSVNVYFNYTGSSFSDYSADKKSSGSDNSRPDFSGNMPADFDPDNIPDFNRRKDD